MRNLSCRYLDNLNNHTVKEYYADLTSALKAVEDGEAWGALYFNENYTDSLVARLALGEFLKLYLYSRVCKAGISLCKNVEPTHI